MRRVAVTPPESYDVEMACSCDRVFTQLAPGTALSMISRLKDLAELAELVPIPSPTLLRRAGIDSPSLCFTVDDLLVVYEISASRRMLTVTDLLVKGANGDVPSEPAHR